MRSPQFYAGVVRAILFFSFLCHLVAFVAPGWLCLKRTVMVGHFAYRETENLESYGVWFMLRCEDNEFGAGTCVPDNYYTSENVRHKFIPGKSWVLHWQLKTTAALVACIFGTVFVHMQRNLLLQYRPGQEPPKRIKYVLAFVCSCVAGSLLSWPVGQFIRLNQFYQGTWTRGVTTTIPYALIAAGVGAFINWVAVLMLLIILCKRMCIQETPQMVMLPPTSQAQMMPLMPVQGAPNQTGYAEPMNPMYQAQQHPYQAPPQGNYPGEYTHYPPGQHYNYRPPMNSQMDNKALPDGQFYPPAHQYPPHQYNPQSEDDNMCWQQRSLQT